MHLALGFDCRVYDFGSRGNNWEVDDAPSPTTELQYVPRAVWWGLEWSRYALNSVWHLETKPPLLRGYNVQDLFDSKLRNIPKPLVKKLKYYRAYTIPNLSEVRLRGYHAQTLLDGDKDAYRTFLHAHAARTKGYADGMVSGAEDSCNPDNWTPPLRMYDASTARRVGEMRRRQQ